MIKKIKWCNGITYLITIDGRNDKIKNDDELNKLLDVLYIYCKNIAYTNIKWFDIDDLTQQIMQHMLKVIVKYDERPGNSFKTFIYLCIQNFIKNLYKNGNTKFFAAGGYRYEFRKDDKMDIEATKSLTEDSESEEDKIINKICKEDNKDGE